MMATIKANRSVHPSKEARQHNPRATDRNNRRIRNRKLIHFLEARGKVVKDIEFYAGSDSIALALRFKDNTSLSFDFATGFATEAHFSRWKDGNERVLRYWPRISCEPLF